MLVLKMIATWWTGNMLIRSLQAWGTEGSWKQTQPKKRSYPVIKPYLPVGWGDSEFTTLPFPGCFSMNAKPRKNISVSKDRFCRNSHKTLWAQRTGSRGPNTTRWWLVDVVDVTTVKEGRKCLSRHGGDDVTALTAEAAEPVVMLHAGNMGIYG